MSPFFKKQKSFFCLIPPASPSPPPYLFHFLLSSEDSGCFQGTRAEMNTCDRDPVAHKGQTMLLFGIKSLQIPALDRVGGRSIPAFTDLCDLDPESDQCHPHHRFSHSSPWKVLIASS